MLLLPLLVAQYAVQLRAISSAESAVRLANGIALEK